MQSRSVAVASLVAVAMSGCGYQAVPSKATNQHKQASLKTTVTTATVNLQLPSVGLSWTPNQIFFVSSEDGWALVKREQGNLTIYGTTNGGHSWLPELNIEDTSTAPLALERMNSTGCALVGVPGVIELTPNGGSTWQTLSAPSTGDYRMTSLIGTSWFTVGEITGTAGVEEGPLYEWSSAAQLWRQISTLHPQGDLTGIIFNSPQDGWMGVAPTAMGIIVLDATTNGGQTWNQVSMPTLVGSLAQDLVSTQVPIFFGHSAILPVVDTFSGSTYISHLTDGGLIWDQPLKVPGSIWTFVDTTHGWSASGTRFWRTTNGGHKWTLNILPSGATIIAFDFISPQIGWAAISTSSGKEAILSTSDGGHSWTSP